MLLLGCGNSKPTSSKIVQKPAEVSELSLGMTKKKDV